MLDFCSINALGNGSERPFLNSRNTEELTPLENIERQLPKLKENLKFNFIKKLEVRYHFAASLKSITAHIISCEGIIVDANFQFTELLKYSAQ